MFDRFVSLEVLPGLVLGEREQLFYFSLLRLEGCDGFFGFGNLSLFLAPFGSCGFLGSVVEFGIRGLYRGVTLALTVV